MFKIQELAERVDRLLLRHAEVLRTNGLLQQQVSALTQERDSLRSRLNAARQRIDVLLERLAPEAPNASAAASTVLALNGQQSRIESPPEPSTTGDLETRVACDNRVQALTDEQAR